MTSIEFPLWLHDIPFYERMFESRKFKLPCLNKVKGAQLGNFHLPEILIKSCIETGSLFFECMK